MEKGSNSNGENQNEDTKKRLAVIDKMVEIGDLDKYEGARIKDKIDPGPSWP